MERLDPMSKSKVMEQILNAGKKADYYMLPFTAIRNGNGIIKYTDKNTISVEAFEEMLPAISSGKCTTLEELYYAYMFRSKPTPIVVDDPNFVSTMVINRAVSKATEPSRSIFVDTVLLKEAKERVKDVISRSREIFELGEIDDDELQESIDKHLVYVESEEYIDDYGQPTVDHFFAKRWHGAYINKIRKSIEEDPERLHIFIGDPGSGKSFQGIKTMGDKHILVIALSNVVASSIVARARNNSHFGYDNYTFWSYAKTHFMLKMQPESIENFDGFILEESSMLSCTELDILLAVFNTKKPVCVLGDTAQLPGFLGLGNMLEGLIKTFPERVTELTKNFRAASSPNLVAVYAGVKHDHKLIDTSKMTDVIASSDTLNSNNKALQQWLEDVKNGDDAFACAFKKEDVIALNNQVLEHIFGLSSRLKPKNDSYSSKVDVFSEMLLKNRSFEAVCKSNLRTGAEFYCHGEGVNIDGSPANTC